MVGDQFITESVIRKRTITIPIQEKEKLTQAMEYNERMNANRARMNDIRLFRNAYLAAGLVLDIGYLIWAFTMKNMLIYFYVAFVLICLFIFGIMKSNLFLVIHMVASVVPLFFDWLFGIFLVIKLFLGIVYLRWDEPIRREIDYPEFHNICIELLYEDGHSTRVK